VSFPNAANLTPHATTGVGSWTDAELKAAILDGTAKGGGSLCIMPKFRVAGLSDSQAQDIVAYLRTLTAIDKSVPDACP
jgi:hypothetical protein